MSKSATSSVFVYDSYRYLFDVRIPAYLASVLLCFSAVLFILRLFIPIAAVVFIVAGYTVFNTFCAKSYPQTIEIDPESFSFYSFGRQDRFLLKNITQIQLRENLRSKSLYIRINGGSFLHGRYFIACRNMHTKTESGVNTDLVQTKLYEYFLELDKQLNPDSLRVRSRSN